MLKTFVIAGISQAKEANTRRGPQFWNWVRSKYPIVSEEEFKNSNDRIILLEGGELGMMYPIYRADIVDN